jgi:transcription elongation factor GreB
MSKAFTKETENDDDSELEGGLPPLTYLLNKERPAVTSAVSWAAKNGDRSENADYQYGKKRLREIDRRIRFLTKRLDNAEIVDPAAPRDPEVAERVFFGATVTYANEAGDENTITIVGIDELDLRRGHITWISPLARTLMKARAGDAVTLRAPGGEEELEIIDVRYEGIEVESFVPQAPTTLNVMNPPKN